MTRLVGVKLTEQEQGLLMWLMRHHGWVSVSDGMRNLILTHARLQGAPTTLRLEADRSREEHPPRKRPLQQYEEATDSDSSLEISTPR